MTLKPFSRFVDPVCNFKNKKYETEDLYDWVVDDGEKNIHIIFLDCTIKWQRLTSTRIFDLSRGRQSRKENYNRYRSVLKSSTVLGRLHLNFVTLNMDTFTKFSVMQTKYGKPYLDEIVDSIECCPYIRLFRQQDAITLSTVLITQSSHILCGNFASLLIQFWLTFLSYDICGWASPFFFLTVAPILRTTWPGRSTTVNVFYNIYLTFGYRFRKIGGKITFAGRIGMEQGHGAITNQRISEKTGLCRR